MSEDIIKSSEVILFNSPPPTILCHFYINLNYFDLYKIAEWKE